MPNDKNMQCYLCGSTNASELPKLGPWDHVACPTCGKYRIHYDVISVLPGLDEIKKKQVIKELTSIVKEKQDKETLRYGMIHFLLQVN